VLLLVMVAIPIGVARGPQGVQVYPQSDGKEIFSRHFCWNEAKMGMNLVRCTPADEMKGSWWQYMKSMAM